MDLQEELQSRPTCPQWILIIKTRKNLLNYKIEITVNKLLQ